MRRGAPSRPQTPRERTRGCGKERRAGAGAAGGARPRRPRVARGRPGCRPQAELGLRRLRANARLRRGREAPAKGQVRGGLRRQLLKAPTRRRRPAAPPPPASDRTQVSRRAGCGSGNPGPGGMPRPKPSGPRRDPPRNRSPYSAVLGLVVPGSSRSRRASASEGARSGHEELHFPEGRTRRVTGKAPRQAALRGRNGAGPGGSWLARGPRVVQPEAVPG